MPAQQAQRHFATDQKILETGKPEQYEETLTDASGRVRDLLTRKRLIQDSRGQKFVLAHITDLTEFRRAEAQIRYSMEHDGLTGLANSTLFRNRLSQLLTREPEGHLPSVVLMDLDRFRNINDAFGRTTGDSLLVQFAKRLLAHAHPGDLAARIASDEFAIVSRTAIQRPAVDRFAAAVLDDLNSAPFDSMATVSIYRQASELPQRGRTRMSKHCTAEPSLPSGKPN
jgi:diguanylate cyclase (GGDEF)-like protein